MTPRMCDRGPRLSVVAFVDRRGAPERYNTGLTAEGMTFEGELVGSVKMSLSEKE